MRDLPNRLSLSLRAHKAAPLSLSLFPAQRTGHLSLTQTFSPSLPAPFQSGAAAFIETLTTNSLKVDPDELLAHMLAAGAVDDHQLSFMSQVRGVCWAEEGRGEGG